MTPIWEQKGMTRDEYIAQNKARNTSAQPVTSGRDHVGEMETLNKLGVDKANMTPDDEKNLFEAHYSPEELSGITDYKSLLKSNQEEARKSAERVNLLGTTSDQAFQAQQAFDPAQSISILENMLRDKQDVGQYENVRDNELLKRSGLATSGIKAFPNLSTALQISNKTMEDRYNSFANVLSSSASILESRNKNLKNQSDFALENYKLAVDDYRYTRNLLEGKIDNIVQHQQALDISEREIDIWKEKQQFTWDLQNKDSIDKPSGVAETSDVSEMYDMGSGQNSDNCIIYLRASVTNLPFGLFTKQDKKMAIDKAGVINDGENSMANANIGDAILTSEGKWGHGAKIMDIQDDYFILDEANYKTDTITQGRKIKMNDPKIMGYIPNTGQEAIQISTDTSNLPIIEGTTGEGVTEGIDQQISGLKTPDKKTTPEEDVKSAVIEMSEGLKERVGEDGYLTQEDYNIALRFWVSEGFSPEDFETYFSNYLY